MRHKTAVTKNLRSTGFTLIELLTVIAIVAILAAILIPAVGKVRKNAMTTKKASAYRQYHIANTMYANDNKGYCVLAQDSRKEKENWRSLLAPYLSDSNMSLGQINEQGIYACPFYKDLYPDSKSFETGVGMNQRLRLPQQNTKNFFGESESGNGNSAETKLSAITFPERRLLFGDVSEQFSFANTERLDTTRHDNGTTGMFIRFDGSVAFLSQEEAELAFTDPSKRYTPSN